jgi:hypothetical protein
MAKKRMRSRAERPRAERSRAERLTHPLLEKLGPIPAAAEIFLYSVKIVCGKQTRQTVVVSQAPGRACTRPRSTFTISISGPGPL